LNRFNMTSLYIPAEKNEVTCSADLRSLLP
jgi:hypothetical protein